MPDLDLSDTKAEEERLMAAVEQGATCEVFLGRYQALRVLGEGGMGRVFLARELSTGRQVVVKVMHDRFATDPRFRQGFRREMLLMKRFHHPNAVELYDTSAEDSDRPCIVMEYVAGVTLDALLQRHRRLPAVRFGALLGQLCHALYAAHAAGIIHRDLTPVNVMVTRPDTAGEQVKVMDFGLALLGGSPYIPLEKLTGSGTYIGGGTPDYVCPEQIRGDEVDHRGDLYSLGVLMFKALTGLLPFEHATEPGDILRAHLDTPPPSFGDVGVGTVPRPVEAVVQRCLCKYPAERPRDALELARCYEEAIGRKILPEGELTAPPPPVTPEVAIDPQHVVDQLEAWMPEPIAVVKLRGFVHDLGGEFLESEPGLVRFRLRDPSSPPPPSPTWLMLVGLAKKPEVPVYYALLDLILEKKAAGQQSQLRITVQMRPDQNPRRAQELDWKEWCGQVCRELRGYLISR
jgi:serine/threonine-protein kinase